MRAILFGTGHGLGQGQAEVEPDYGGTDRGDDHTSGGWLRLNSDFDEGAFDGSVVPIRDYDNPGVACWDGEIVPMDAS